MTPDPTHPYEILDVFTDTPMQGNQLAVFTAGEEIPSRLMQQTARELNLSETVFLLPGDDEADAHVRIFTPAAEMPFAGHPTLGAAYVVGERDHLDVVRLRTQVGVIPVTLSRRHEEIVLGEMEQPIPTWEPFAKTHELIQALHLSEPPILPVEQYTNGPTHVMVALETLAQVAALSPDLTALRELGGCGFSCFAHEGPTVKSRMFAPGLGVAEDPATGSAAGPLALHLARYGAIEFARRSSSARGSRSTALRSSTPRSTARPRRSSGSRSAAAPSAWRPGTIDSSSRTVDSRSRTIDSSSHGRSGLQ
jgi:trans-2,3-dihydro-3-hydroxyanthranilate isomerase